MNHSKHPLDTLLDDACRELDLRSVNEPDDALLVAESRWWMRQRHRVRWARRITVGGTLLVAAMLWLAGRSLTEPYTTIGQLSLLGLAVVLASRGGALAQVVTRAALWAVTLFAGGVWWIFVPWVVGPSASAQAYATPAMGGVVGVTADLLGLLVPVAALLVLGMHGLERPCERAFRPVAYRRLLGLSLVMGLADAALLFQLGLFDIFVLDVLHFPGNSILWLLVAWLLVGAWGLYRMRAWGLAVLAAGNLAEIWALMARSPELLGDEMLVLMVTAVVQLLLPLPVYGAMLRRRAGAPAPRWDLGSFPMLLLAGLALAAIGQWLVMLPAILGA